MPEVREYALEALIPEGQITAARRDNVLRILRGCGTKIRGGNASSVEQAVAITGEFGNYSMLTLILMIGFIGMVSGLFPPGTTTNAILPQVMDERNRRYEGGCVVYRITGPHGGVRDFYFKLPPAPPNMPQA